MLGLQECTQELLTHSNHPVEGENNCERERTTVTLQWEVDNLNMGHVMLEKAYNPFYKKIA
jgi:hypothetical protein